MRLIKGFLSLSNWGRFWVTWAATGIVAEVIALVKHSKIKVKLEDGTEEERDAPTTLSEWVWLVRKATKGQGFYSLFLMFLVWLVIHFWREGTH